MLEFNILKGQYLNRLDKNVVSADTTDLKAQFKLAADFAGTITVWWRRSDVNNTYTSTLAADGTCTIPAEALAATDKAVYGPYDHDVFVSISDTGRTTTNEYKLTVLRSAFSTNATPGTGGSPTAYEELVEQFDELKADNQTFKDSMTEQQETFENTVTENVDNIRYVVETETAPPIIEEASGAEITLDDSAYRQVRGLNLYGYSKQVQTTGANIACLPDIGSTSSAGVTWQCKDGIVTVNGTAVEVSSSQAIGLDYDFTKKKGRFYVSGSSGDVSVIVFVSKNGERSYYKDQSFVLDGTETRVVLYMQVFNGGTASNEIIKPMLNSGTSALPWEPYSGGVASPSPDWAQPIHSVADEVNLLESLTMDINTPSAEFPETSDTLYVMLCPKSGTSQVNIRLRYNDGSYGQDVAVVGSAGSNGIEYPIFITPSKPCTGVSIYNAISNAARTLSYGMVAISDTALPWRPYGHNVTVESQGANLIDVSKTINAASNGITVKALGDGTFSYSGTPSSDEHIYTSVNVWIAGTWGSAKELIHLRGGEYTALVNEAIYVNDETMLNSESKIKAPSNGVSVTGVRAPSVAAGTYHNKIIYPMISRGSTPLPWQPYVAPSSALIALTDSLRGVPVSSGGNYTDESGQQWIADYIYRRQTDGKWMVWRNCGAGVYDGSEDENWRALSAFPDRYAIFNGGALGNVFNERSTNFIADASLSRAGTFQIDINKDVVYKTQFTSNLGAWKAWLSSNPQTVVYQLATPTIEELPDDVQAELNGLYTYNLHTDMWNNDGAYMNLKYVADTKTWINNKIAGLSTAMLNQN